RVVDDLVGDAEWVGLRGPAETAHAGGPVFFGLGVDLVDRDDFAGLGLGEEVIVVKAPPGRGVATEGLAAVGWVGARPRLDIQDANLKDIPRLGAADVNRPGANMDAQALAGAAAEKGRLHRPGPASVNVLPLL